MNDLARKILDNGNGRSSPDNKIIQLFPKQQNLEKEEKKTRDIECSFIMTIKPLMKTAEQYLTILKNAGYEISDFAKSLIKEPGAFSEKICRDINLYRASTEQILGNIGTLPEILECLKNNSATLITTETAISFRLQYSQPIGEWLMAAMTPVHTNHWQIFRGGPLILRVTRDQENKWLSASYGYPDQEWPLNQEWFFEKTK